MSILHAIILGAIEGITEFLPISSTGHMVIASHFLHISETEFVKSFQIIIQLAAILAVIIPFWKRLFVDRAAQLKILAAFIPTGAIGFILYKLIKSYLIGNETIVAWALLIGGIVIVAFEYFMKKPGTIDTIEKIPYSKAVGIGLAQTLAVIPGVSRSAATIIGGRALGVNKQTIVEFSFLLAVPTMLAATGLDLVKSAPSFTSNELGILLVGCITAFLTAWVSVKFFLSYISNHSLTAFGIYRICLALFLLFFIL